ncbi:MAG TPA: hypothetical protein VLJ16_10420 [Acidobacteriota bacterium]|nr:hypothetical protein [Acidobacteriota bacterium]
MRRKPASWMGLAFVLGLCAQASAQFLPGEIAQFPKWEEFLRTAEVVGQKQLSGAEAVTNPWVLTLKLGDVTHRGLWKNVEGRPKGYLEGWRYEIAACRIDRLLGLNMVPPTVERRFRGDRGSCQYWTDDAVSLRDKNKRKEKVPPAKVFDWNRATYLQRFFDNLIANEDRNEGDILITQDWRMILIDHSRTFRLWKKLLFTAKSPEGPKLMSSLPRAIVEKAKALTAESVRAAVGDYLTEAEIEAMLFRRDLILKEIDTLIKLNGEASTLYEK